MCDNVLVMVGGKELSDRQSTGGRILFAFLRCAETRKGA